jgi:hypothetical protein
MVQPDQSLLGRRGIAGLIASPWSFHSGTYLVKMLSIAKNIVLLYSCRLCQLKRFILLVAILILGFP